MEKTDQKKSLWESKMLSTKIKTADVKLVPEAAFGYLLGPAFALIANSFVNTYLSQYWNRVLGLSTWAYTFTWLLPLLATIAIVIGNLLIGRLFERNPSIAGKARPYILVGMPLMAVALLILFLVPFPYDTIAAHQADPSSNATSIATLAFISVGYILYYAVAYPFYYTSHSALVNLSTRDGSKRSLLATASNAAQIVASGAAGMVAPYLIDFLGLLPSDETGATVNEMQDANRLWVVLMVILIVVQVVGCLLEYFFTRERITEETVKLRKENPDHESLKVKKVSTTKQASICVRDKYWWFIIIFYFLYQLGGMLKNNDATWFAQSFFNGQSALAGTINIVGAIPTALGMLVIWPLARKFGKANCIKAGAFIAFLMGCLGFVVLINPSDGGLVTGMAITAFCLKAIGTVPAMYISMALLSDVIEHQEALYGIRTDGFTMAVYGSIMIAMPGVANAIISLVNGNVAISGNVQNQQLANTFLYFGGEAFCYLIIAIMFLFMKVEKFSEFDKKAIVQDQKEYAEKEGLDWMDPSVRLQLEQEQAEEAVHQEQIEKLRKHVELNNEKRAKQLQKTGKTELIELNFEQELAEYEAERMKKAEASATKKAENARLKDEKAQAKQAELDAKLQAMTDEQRQAYNDKIQRKAERMAQEAEAYRIKFDELREATREEREANLAG